MTKKAFTLIELLVVITIIILTSSVGILYFFRQVSSIKIASDTEQILDIVDKLDSRVDNRKVLDYSLYFKKNSFGFTGSINNLGIDYRQFVNMDFKYGTGTLYTNFSSTGSNYNFKIFSGIKFQGKYVIDAQEEYKYNFSKNIHSKILAKLQGITLNTLYIYYYSLDNLIINNENKLELIGINSKLDKTGGNFSSVEIKNLNGKKYIIPDGGSDINKIYLFFEREGVENFIEIKK